MTKGERLPNRQVQRKTVPDEIADDLRTRIITGEFDGGRALRQELLAAEYGVSRMPVREALRQLEAEGLVEFQTHRGAIVYEPTVQDVEEMFLIRELLEPALLREAVPRLTERDFRELEHLQDELEASYRERNVVRWGEINWKFHQAIYRPAKRERMLQLVANLHVQIDRCLRMGMSINPTFEQAAAEHRELLSLLKARRVEPAVTALAEHVRSSRLMVTEALAKRSAESRSRQGGARREHASRTADGA